LENIAGPSTYKLIDDIQLNMPAKLQEIDAENEWVTGTKYDKLKILYVSQTLRRPQLDEDHRPELWRSGIPAREANVYHPSIV
jgi:hypothetical protein